jgi:hypothetical protein
MPPSPVRLDFVLAIMPILRARLFLEERNMVREPMLTTVPIADLRPTQLTVGMREVEAKRSAGAKSPPTSSAPSKKR